ncbi:hypothetical protein K438DRAFT_448033 [Mycena galopus ATCC 62051]|nr:hypothetical protein K438DRAFT_448033 [Mycena galopus ATCC 62051]
MLTAMSEPQARAKDEHKPGWWGMRGKWSGACADGEYKSQGNIGGDRPRGEGAGVGREHREMGWSNKCKLRAVQQERMRRRYRVSAGTERRRAASDSTAQLERAEAQSGCVRTGRRAQVRPASRGRGTMRMAGAAVADGGRMRGIKGTCKGTDWESVMHTVRSARVRNMRRGGGQRVARAGQRREAQMWLRDSVRMYRVASARMVPRDARRGLEYWGCASGSAGSSARTPTWISPLTQEMEYILQAVTVVEFELQRSWGGRVLRPNAVEAPTAITSPQVVRKSPKVGFWSKWGVKFLRPIFKAAEDQEQLL